MVPALKLFRSTYRASNIFLKRSAGCAADMYFPIVSGDRNKILCKFFRQRRDGRSFVGSRQGPQRIRSSVAYVGTDGVCPLTNIEIQRLWGRVRNASGSDGINNHFDHPVNGTRQTIVWNQAPPEQFGTRKASAVPRALC